MARTKLTRRRGPAPTKSVEGPPGDPEVVPLDRLIEGPEVEQTSARPRKRRRKQRVTDDPHLADEIKAGKLVPLARMRVGWLKVKEWWTELPDTLKDRLRAMGFGDFMSIVAFRPDRPLVSALSERWRDETHSFHFPTGEMTITLEDIARCWGLRVSGLPVSTGAEDANPDFVRPQLHSLFGARPYLGASQIDVEWLWEAYGPERTRILDRWARDQTGFLAEFKARMAIAGDPPVKGGDSEPVSTTGERVRMGAVDATHPEVGTHEGGDPSSSASRPAGHVDDVVMLEAVDEESDSADSDEDEGDAVYGLGDDVSDPDDVGYDRPEDELFASDDGDDLVDEGDSEDEGVRPQRAARRVIEVERDDDGGEGAGDDEGEDGAIPPDEYEWREVPVDGYYRRKRVGIPCETFHVAKKKGTRPDVATRPDIALRRPRLISARQGEDESLRAFLLYFFGKCLFANATGNRVSGTLLRFVNDLNQVGSYAWGAAALAFLFRSLDDRCRVQRGHRSLRGFTPILQVWMWEHILQCRPERLPARLSLTPRAAQWYPNATLRGFADILPMELAKRIKDLGMRPSEQVYRFILNELVGQEVIWRPYQGGPDDELTSVQEGRHLFERDIWLHAPQIAVRLVVSRVARQLGCHQVVLTPEAAMSYSYRGWSERKFSHSHPYQPEIDDWNRGGKASTFGADAKASGDHERRGRDATCRYTLPESYSGRPSYSARNCTEAIETLMSFRTAPPVGTERQEACSSGDGSGKVASDVESVLHREVLRLSELMKEKDAMTMELRASLMAREGELKLRDAVIDVLADTHERDRELAMSEAMRSRLESDLQTLRAEVDRLQASEVEARSKCDRVLADLLSERATSAAQIDELRAKVRSLEASAQSGAIVAVPSAPEGWFAEKSRLQDRHMDQMDLLMKRHEREIAALLERLDRYRRRAEERGYAISSSTRVSSQRALSPASVASSARHKGAAP